MTLALNEFTRQFGHYSRDAVCLYADNDLSISAKIHLPPVTLARAGDPGHSATSNDRPRPMYDVIENLPAGVGTGDTPESLSLIHSCGAAIWRRQPLARFQSWIDDLDPEKLPKARMILPSHYVREAVIQICESSGTPDCAERSMLVDDIAALAEMFCQTMSASALQLRLDVVTDNACRKFHIDAVKARLVCTYRGTGTQYTVSQSKGEPGQVHTVPTGAPVLLRGTLWQEATKSRVFHRSPPIEGTQETRLVLVLDPREMPEDNSMTLTHTTYGE